MGFTIEVVGVAQLQRAQKLIDEIGGVERASRS